MQFNSKLSEAEFAECRKMTNSKMARLNGLLAPLVGLWMIGEIIVKTSRSPTPRWGFVAILCLVFAVTYVGSLYYQNRVWARQLTQLNAKRDQFIFTNDGMKFEAPDGTTGMMPWKNFKGRHQGHLVMLLDQVQGGYVVLPVSKFSEMERPPIRQFLQSHIASAIQ